MEILKELVGTTHLRQFLANNLFRAPFAAPLSAQKFAGIANWKVLDEIFAAGHDNCWLAVNGRLPNDALLNTGRLTTDQATGAFQIGRTVLIRHAENAHPKLAYLADSFREAFHSPVDIQIYATPTLQEGFDWHYDVEDVFIIQSSGEKEFRLIPNTVTPRPLPVMTIQNCRFNYENRKTEIRCWLKPGDFLYIPAGYWHKARAIKDSFHVSVGVLCQSAHSLP